MLKIFTVMFLANALSYTLCFSARRVYYRWLARKEAKRIQKELRRFLEVGEYQRMNFDEFHNVVDARGKFNAPH